MRVGSSPIPPTDRMRAVFLTHNYPRYAGDVAGGFLHTLAVALKRRGVDVRVVAPSDEGQGGCDELDGIPVRRVRYGDASSETLAYRGTFASAIGSPQGLRSLARLNRAFRAGALAELVGANQAVVHAHWWFPAGVAAPASVPLVITCHGTDVRLLQRNPFIRWLGRRTLRRADVVTTVSKPSAALLEQFGGVSVPLDHVQPMPVTDVARSWSTGGGGVVVIGRLSEQKRVDLAIRAYADARSRGLTMPLTIVGDGPARAALLTMVGGMGLTESVHFAGEVPPLRVPDFLATADCCLMTAEAEGLGLTAAEALMQGVPVVACRDGGGVLDVVLATGAGRVVAPSAEAISCGLRELLADAGARAAAKAAGEQWRRRLSPDFVAERCLGWYRQALHA